MTGKLKAKWTMDPDQDLKHGLATYHRILVDFAAGPVRMAAFVMLGRMYPGMRYDEVQVRYDPPSDNGPGNLYHLHCPVGAATMHSLDSVAVDSESGAADMALLLICQLALNVKSKIEQNA